MTSKLYGELSKICLASLMTRQIFGRIQRFGRINASIPNTVFQAVSQTLQITVCEKVCGQTRLCTNIFIILVRSNFSFLEFSLSSKNVLFDEISSYLIRTVSEILVS